MLGPESVNVPEVRAVESEAVRTSAWWFGGEEPVDLLTGVGIDGHDVSRPIDRSGENLPGRRSAADGAEDSRTVIVTDEPVGIGVDGLGRGDRAVGGAAVGRR